jgi:hypothetical protein
MGARGLSIPCDIDHILTAAVGSALCDYTDFCHPHDQYLRLFSCVAPNIRVSQSDTYHARNGSVGELATVFQFV